MSFEKIILSALKTYSDKTKIEEERLAGGISGRVLTGRIIPNSTLYRYNLNRTKFNILHRIIHTIETGGDLDSVLRDVVDSRNRSNATYTVCAIEEVLDFYDRTLLADLAA